MDKKIIPENRILNYSIYNLEIVVEKWILSFGIFIIWEYWLLCIITYASVVTAITWNNHIVLLCFFFLIKYLRIRTQQTLYLMFKTYLQNFRSICLFSREKTEWNYLISYSPSVCLLKMKLKKLNSLSECLKYQQECLSCAN